VHLLTARGVTYSGFIIYAHQVILPHQCADRLLSYLRSISQKDFEKIRGKKNQEADDIRGFREKYQSNRVSMQIHDLEKEAKLRKQQNEEDLVLGKKHSGGGDPSRLNLWRLSDDLGDPQALFATRTIRQWTIWYELHVALFVFKIVTHFSFLIAMFC
jgi:hypothetical protein